MFEKVAVVEIVAGRHGLWGLRSGQAVPLGGLVILRNATLEDRTWRTGAGAATLGTAIGSQIDAAIDFWPDAVTQRTLVACADGSLRKDDGRGKGWVTLASGLLTSGTVPMWSVAGAESAGRNRKAFCCDRQNAPRVVSGDPAAATVISKANADWSGLNQPGWMTPHQGSNWAGGVASNPHFVYKSLAADHEDFQTTIRRYPCGPEPKQQLLVGAMSYKGGLLVFGYPIGVYWINTADATDTNWFAVKVAHPGAAGPRAFTAFEDDVVWVDPLGGWHTLSATAAQGSLRATDLTFRKLGRFAAQRIAVGDSLRAADLVYDSDRRKIMLAHVRAGSVVKDGRLDMDLTAQGESGENWVTWDRDRNTALFLRTQDGVETPTIGDDTGQLWLLERENRSKAGVGYTFEWMMKDTDFAPVLPSWAGRKKNLHFLQIETDMRGTATHTVEVWRDGRLRQVVTMSLTAGSGGITFGDAASDTFDEGTFGPEHLQTTAYRKLLGQCNRLALRGYSSGVNEDVSIAKIRIGLTRAA